MQKAGMAGYAGDVARIFEGPLPLRPPRVRAPSWRMRTIPSLVVGGAALFTFSAAA